MEDETRTVHTAIGFAASGANETDIAEELSLNSIENDASPVIKLVRSTLYDALKAEASDIHLETSPNGLVIKYRLDGVLSQVGAISELQLAEQVVSRIKVMSELDIAERRVPQDGRFKVSMNGREVDFTKRTMKGYVMVDDTGMKTKKEFNYWIKLCLEFNNKARSSKKKK